MITLKLQSTFEPILGKSKISKKLAQQVDQAATDLKTVTIQGPPGSGKTFIAQLIHGKSELKEGFFTEIDCTQLPHDHEQLVKQISVIPLSGKGTLLLDNVEFLSVKQLNKLIEYIRETEATNPQYLASKSKVRIILASAKQIKIPGLEVHHIKLFALAQRRVDIPEFANYFVEKFCRERQRQPLEINQASLRRLISYDYPGNLVELEGVLKRAVMMTPTEKTFIPEQLLWSLESPKNSFRLDLLNQLPWLRQFLLSKWWPEGFWILVMALFIPVTISGFFGSENRSESIILNLFWAWWWTFSLLLFPIIGRLWCSVCPFMITGEWVRKLSLWIWPRQLLPWPTKWLNKWGAWFVWVSFTLIYLWEKLWDLPHTPYLSASLLLIITAGAVIGSVIYERRLWCRYLCPIGGMNGMFAKLSMIELRSSQQVCGSQCSVFACQDGSDDTLLTFPEALSTEGQATEGCPLHLIPSKLQDNRNCVLCMGCLKGCPNRSVQLNLRFPANDLLHNHQGFWAEVALLLLLFGGVFVHYSSSLFNWLKLKDVHLDSQHLLTAIPVIAMLLSIPFFATYLTHQVSRKIDREMPDYLTVIYVYLPMTLMLNLVYYLPSAVVEAGNILPIIANNFGYSGVGLPVFAWSMDVAVFLQEILLLSAIPLSISLLFKITNRPFLSNLPHSLLITGLPLIFLQLI
ncbi:MAG: sigma 54-interacting transcriptional regulator [Gomphosphaeria aponina SAG 52.96 = DSM 107014]|uniref:Sigma 54-interacting transcriptional regulator n=1 Tax=Gomphosphaeria aponina SAG 52.96 = DSM 107014 TaxID=1521640 RepID=A0A941JPB4_9CHRO|nr:sigma 54-interacting transcriptional regulator [Gomphosphaeria aponina SAG 52.96 = DSM 107014]